MSRQVVSLLCSIGIQVYCWMLTSFWPGCSIFHLQSSSHHLCREKRWLLLALYPALSLYLWCVWERKAGNVCRRNSVLTPSPPKRGWKQSRRKIWKESTSQQEASSKKHFIILLHQSWHTDVPLPKLIMGCGTIAIVLHLFYMALKVWNHLIRLDFIHWGTLHEVQYWQDPRLHSGLMSIVLLPEWSRWYVSC